MSFRTSSILVVFICILASMCVLSCSCASFHTSSILVASIHILASLHAVSCSVHLQFSAVTCVSHVLQCAHVHGAVCRLTAVPASKAAHARPVEFLICVTVLLAELIVHTKQACFGQDVSAEGPLGPVSTDLHQQQSEFPKCMNGIRLRSLFKKSQSVDFVTALLDALLKFLDSTDGSQRGLANWLAPVLGVDLLEKCNYNCCLAPFLVHGACTAAHFRECWEHSVA